MNTIDTSAITFRALAADLWGNFEDLFGPRGACAGCWCTFGKLPNKDFKALAYAGNKAAQQSIVRAGAIPGILAYWGAEPMGWIAVQPRNEFPRLGRSRVLKPVDNQPVWSVTCFFTRRDFRGNGVTVASAFRKAGFKEVARNLATRPIFRYVIGG
jgi:hypothetical protein